MGSAETRASEIVTDEEYRRLEVKHRGYDERLEELRNRRYLTEEEKLEEVRLKKLKLALKDKMEAMLRRLDE